MMNQSPTITPNYVNGQLSNGQKKHLAVVSPVDGRILSKVVLSNKGDLDKAVDKAQKAFPAWSQKTLKERVQVFYTFRQLLIDHLDELGQLIHLENGKTLGEAKAEIRKGIELTEFACSLPQFINDEIQIVSQGIECRFRSSCFDCSF